MKNLKEFDGFLNEGSNENKKYVLVRFGSRPEPRVTEFLRTHVVGRPSLVAGPNAFITFFESGHSFGELVSGLEALNIKFQLIDQSKITGAGGSTGTVIPTADERKLNELRRKLQDAIRKEDYERAADLRNQIREITGEEEA